MAETNTKTVVVNRTQSQTLKNTSVYNYLLCHELNSGYNKCASHMNNVEH